MKRYYLSKKEIKKLKEEFPESGIDKSDKLEYIKNDDLELILRNDSPAFFYHDDKIYPTLKSVHGHEESFRKITVDMGAVKFVCSGADIMRPGITETDDNISAGDIVIIIDQKNRKALAVGTSLLSSEEIRAQDKGKTIKNLHWAGDKIWNFKLE